MRERIVGYWRRENWPWWLFVAFAVISSLRQGVSALSDIGFVVANADRLAFIVDVIFHPAAPLLAVIVGFAGLATFGSPKVGLTGTVSSTHIQSYQHVPTIVVYPNRAALNEARGGLEAELNSVNTAWAIWPVGTHAHSSMIFSRTRKPEILILLDPWGKHMKTIAALFDRSPEDLESDILITTRLARKVGINVHWFDGPAPSVLFGNPETDDAWARVEIAIPLSDVRPSVLVSKKSDPRLFGELLEAFRTVLKDDATSLASRRLAERIGAQYLGLGMLHKLATDASNTMTETDIEAHRKRSEDEITALLRAIYGPREREEADFIAAGGAYGKSLADRIGAQRDHLASLFRPIKESPDEEKSQPQMDFEAKLTATHNK